MLLLYVTLTYISTQVDMVVPSDIAESKSNNTTLITTLIPSAIAVRADDPHISLVDSGGDNEQVKDNNGEAISGGAALDIADDNNNDVQFVKHNPSAKDLWDLILPPQKKMVPGSVYSSGSSIATAAAPTDESISSFTLRNNTFTDIDSIHTAARDLSLSLKSGLGKDRVGAKAAGDNGDRLKPSSNLLKTKFTEDTHRKRLNALNMLDDEKVDALDDYIEASVYLRLSDSL